MNEPELCPLCLHAMDEHCYKTVNGELVTLFYCSECECDWLAVGMDEFIALDEPFGTRPITVQLSEATNEHR